VVLVRVFFSLSLFEARTMQTEADSEAGSNGRPFHLRGREIQLRRAVPVPIVAVACAIWSVIGLGCGPLYVG